MSTDSNQYQGLPLTHVNVAVDRAMAEIEKERSGEQNGLYCKWSAINRGMGKYWRFNHITNIAAPSGHGKSYAINQLHDDFTDFTDIIDKSNNTLFRKALNNGYQGKVILIHFGLEMDASDEVIRSLSRKITKSHHYILSSEFDKRTETFNKISDAEMNTIDNRMNYIRNKPIYYVEMTGTVSQIYHTVKYVKEKHPDHQLVVSFDHTLLVKRGDNEKSDGELIAAVAAIGKRIRQEFKAMVIFLSQLNNNIKMADRITVPSMHYPNDSDIYFGSQINWVCDNIWIFPYRPELINIPRYGISQIDTKDLVVAAAVKSRKGIIGEVYLEADLSKGQFIETNRFD